MDRALEKMAVKPLKSDIKELVLKNYCYGKKVVMLKSMILIMFEGAADTRV